MKTVINPKDIGSTGARLVETDLDAFALRLREHLIDAARLGLGITYEQLARALGLAPPGTIHRVTKALERLMEADAVAHRPFIAAIAISKARGGLPAPGFFDCARRLGRIQEDDGGPACRAFHAREFRTAVVLWGDLRCGTAEAQDESTP